VGLHGLINANVYSNPNEAGSYDAFDIYAFDTLTIEGTPGAAEQFGFMLTLRGRLQFPTIVRLERMQAMADSKLFSTSHGLAQERWFQTPRATLTVLMHPEIFAGLLRDLSWLRRHNDGFYL
jgi:hypothetical protein